MKTRWNVVTVGLIKPHLVLVRLLLEIEKDYNFLNFKHILLKLGKFIDHTLFSAITCAKPTISQAALTPSTDPIAYDAEYTVACNTGYKISGGAKMKCGANGGFDQTPSCIGTTYTRNGKRL